MFFRENKIFAKILNLQKVNKVKLQICIFAKNSELTISYVSSTSSSLIGSSISGSSIMTGSGTNILGTDPWAQQSVSAGSGSGRN